MDLGDLLTQLRNELGLKVEFTQILLAFALLLARVLPPILLTPFLGGEVVPSEVKIGLGVMLGLVLFPAITTQVQELPVTAVLFVALMLKELFVGLVLAMVVGMVFDVANVAGGLIDLFSGTTMAQVMVPQIQTQVSLFANLQLQLTTAVFLTLGGHHVVIQAFAESLAVIPLDQYPRFSSGFFPLFDLVIRVTASIFTIGLALSAPALIATFITDIALGMINRVAPQVQVYFVSMQLKPAIAVLVMAAVMHLFVDRIVDEFQGMLRLLGRAIQLLG